MLRVLLYVALAMLITGCPSAMVGTAVLGTSFADERTLGTQIDDIALVSKVQARLAAETDMPSRWLSVDSIQGRVTLMGYLGNQEQINRAVFIAKSFQGVKSVHSEIKVGNPSLKDVMTDSWITAKVKSRLLQDAQTSGISVHVETIDGRVYLQGLVRNDVQYQRAIDLTSRTKGVREVVDMLKINPHGVKAQPKTKKSAKHYGTRKKRGSKSKPSHQAKPQAEQYDTEVGEGAVTPMAINLNHTAKPEVTPVLDLNRQDDIFEETVSGIKNRHKKVKPYAPYEGYDNVTTHQPLPSQRSSNSDQFDRYRDDGYHQKTKDQYQAPKPEKNEDTLKSSQKNGVKQKNSLFN
ncbi:MAG: BON domain-containing protein [Mariprofundaceae bacterium]|nr:BON domain-containing protein [Mariprofundaceae bacterium]